MKKILLVLFLLSSISWAGTYTAATCNKSDVDAVINGPTHTAVDGDTIKIPSGACTWSSGVIVPSSIGITITGIGTPNYLPNSILPSGSCQQTQITLTGTSSVTAIGFEVSPAYGNSTTRLSCMIIPYGGYAVFASILGSCTTSGCPNLRMDNLTFPSSWGNVGSTETNFSSFGINVISDMFGVIDHNQITGISGNFLEFGQIQHDSFLVSASTSVYGDNSWNLAEGYGSANFLFVENNTLNYAGISDNEGGPVQCPSNYLNCRGGGRIVPRFDTFNEDSLNSTIAWHGTESNGRPRGGRAFEYYSNTINGPNGGAATVIGIRSGTGLAWNNTFSAGTCCTNDSFINASTYRTQGSIGGWGACDGSSGYDTNDGTTYYSGTVSSWNSGTSTLTVNGSPGWTTNQWAGTNITNGTPYSLHDVTQSTGTEIISNGSNTLVLSIGGGPGAFTTPVNSDSIQILRATQCIDQAAGRGMGILYSSACSPAIGTSGSCTGNPSPANEVSSPIYIWELSWTNTGSIVGTNTARIIQNRDYYTETVGQAVQSNATSPFNGSSGVGHGALANRPTSCTTGVGYWATDQGSWNQSGSGGQGVLYLCTSTNTWTLSYIPYTYPHPLIGAGNPLAIGSSINGGMKGISAN